MWRLDCDETLPGPLHFFPGSAIFFTKFQVCFTAAGEFVYKAVFISKVTLLDKKPGAKTTYTMGLVSPLRSATWTLVWDVGTPKRGGDVSLTKLVNSVGES